MWARARCTCCLHSSALLPGLSSSSAVVEWSSWLPLTHPHYAAEDVAKLDSAVSWARALDGTEYMPGLVREVGAGGRAMCCMPVKQPDPLVPLRLC